MRTSELAKLADVNTQTLRYYERRGLLPEPGRDPNGYRAYARESVQLVRFVKRAQRLGFTLADIETLLDLAAGGPEGCEPARRLAIDKVADLDHRIAELVAIRDALTRLVDTCERPRTARDCPLLHELDSATEGALP